jgi:hypothetical protein
MYFPYLRARQFELIALKELSTEFNFKNYVTPVLEPVRESLNGLNLANKIFYENNFQPFLIVNPLQGEIPGDTSLLLEYIQTLEDCSFHPAFHFTNNAEFILSSIHNYSLKNVMLICLDGFNDDQSLRDLCESSYISHIMVLEPQKNRQLDRYIKNLHKFYIRLDDLFERQDKNADYLNIPAHKFSEEHLFYKDEGYNGFSDFTVLPGVFIDGGSTPRAVVVHLSYINENQNNEIWIRHFTSTTNDSIANVQLKFAEAARKAVNFVSEHNLENTAISELESYFKEQRYPGLGTIKKISIKNHLFIVSDFLKTKDNAGL